MKKKTIRKVAIIGGRGFIGQALVSELYRNHDKNLDIISLVRQVSRKNLVNEVVVETTADIARVITQFSPHFVFDLSGSYIAEDYLEFQEKNLLVPLSVLDALRDLKSNARYIGASSAAVYNLDKNNENVNENSDISPSTLYGVTKASLENVCSLYARKYNLNITIGRIFNVMGPLQPKTLFPSAAIRSLVQVKKGTLSLDELNQKNFLGLDFTRDFLDVRDVAKAICCLLGESNKGFNVYNICSGIGVKLSDLYLEAHNTILGCNSTCILPKDSVEGYSIYGNNNKFCTAFDWRPVVSIETSLEEQINKILRA